ncbi:MAG: riboflavin biosynthesis protein RibF, partial [Oscillospiraceae bacterium]|nr:riboflavin biosynthesis protein RibF [Oscillospiraceae bacterium]
MSEKTVIALGFFDGVHLGHAALLKKTLERAAELGATPAAFTFDRSPKEFVTGIPVPLLTTVKEREMTLRGWYDMEKVFVEPFDKAMMTMPWEDFITELLVKKYHAVHLVAGHDFHFGYKNEGSPERLAEKCRELGLGCDIIGCVEIGGETVSSTRIRKLVEAGQMRDVTELLGRRYTIRGTVLHGQGIGRVRLFPTANIVPPENSVVPKFGVYATRV